MSESGPEAFAPDATTIAAAAERLTAPGIARGPSARDVAREADIAATVANGTIDLLAYRTEGDARTRRLDLAVIAVKTAAAAFLVAKTARDAAITVEDIATTQATLDAARADVVAARHEQENANT